MTSSPRRSMFSFNTILLSVLLGLYVVSGFLPPPDTATPPRQRRGAPSVVKKQPNRILTVTYMNWLKDFFEPPSSSSTKNSRQVQYPEQYPATYELNNDVTVDGDDTCEEAKLVRPLLKNTQLESRPLQVVYDASKHGWTATAFHSKVDGKGAAVVLCQTSTTKSSFVGGYNPKGWASLGGARPSVAAFLFYQNKSSFQKLQKVGGGGLACANDDPNGGISFGPDGLVIPLRAERPKMASSKLGPYFERGPEQLSSLFENGATELVACQVLVGQYGPDEEIPYSGGVLDMTSG